MSWDSILPIPWFMSLAMHQKGKNHFSIALETRINSFHQHSACEQISIWRERANCWMNYSNHFNATILNNIFHILLKQKNSVSTSGSEKRNEINKLLHFTVSRTYNARVFCRYSTCAFSCICIDENIWRQQLHRKKNINFRLLFFLFPFDYLDFGRDSFFVFFF